jgi:hypothetical protein
MLEATKANTESHRVLTSPRRSDNCHATLFETHRHHGPSMPDLLLWCHQASGAVHDWGCRSVPRVAVGTIHYRVRHPWSVRTDL